MKSTNCRNIHKLLSYINGQLSDIQVANMRHNALFRRFISALTRGGPGGLPRPIEVHAHDPLRYVGDMLGWLHQVGFLCIFLPFGSCISFPS